MRSKLHILFSILPIFFFSFCRKDVGKTIYGNYPNEVGKIMVNKCATSGCHNAISYPASNGLNLTTWDDLFKGGNSGSSVIPFRSDFSSLCYFINTYADLGIINTPTMPYNRTPLSREEVQTIKDWINAGAPDYLGNIKWADNPNRKKVYVTNQGCDVVTVFDAETMLPMRYITVGNNAGIEVPHQVRVSPDSKYWYVIFVNNNILQKYSCTDDKLVGEVALGSNFNWNSFVISDDGTKAYAIAWAPTSYVATVDLVNMQRIHNVLFPEELHGVSLNGNNDLLYVTGQKGNFIMQMDTDITDGNDVKISLDGTPPSSSSILDAHDIILSADKKYLLISCQKTAEVRVYDILNGLVTSTISTGYFPQEFAYSTSKNKLYVTCPYDSTSFPGNVGTVTEIDLNSSFYPSRKVAVGYMPHGICVDDNKKLIYVASRNIFTTGPAPHHTSVCNGRDGFVNYIDLNTFTVTKKKTEISVDPYSAAYRK
jgi:DNA-binding beta-propeller fold protein YncE